MEYCKVEFETIIMGLSAVILDMDGTITRFNLDSRGVKLTLLKELEQLNLRAANMSERSTIVILLKQMKQHLDTENYGKFRNRLYDLLEEMEVKAAGETLHPGVLDTLQKLKERQLRIGLVTNNSRKGANLTLEHLGLSGFFHTVVTRDDCEEMKPDPSPLNKALKELDARPDEAIFVGDSVNDIIAAKEAGVGSVAIATGTSSLEELLQYEPDYVLDSLNDLPNLIAKTGWEQVTIHR
jgi:pyrophosphatase PpaX